MLSLTDAAKQPSGAHNPDNMIVIELRDERYNELIVEVTGRSRPGGRLEAGKKRKLSGGYAVDVCGDEPHTRWSVLSGVAVSPR